MLSIKGVFRIIHNNFISISDRNTIKPITIYKDSIEIRSWVPIVNRLLAMHYIANKTYKSIKKC